VTGMNVSVSVGKRVGGALYVHVSALNHLPDEEQTLLSQAIDIAGGKVSWNVARFEEDIVALLRYEDFEESVFPALLESCRVDLLEKRATFRSYLAQANPPILHRKELLLTPEHSSRPVFEALTRDLENLGVFHNSHQIGSKSQWYERLAARGVTIEGHTVVIEEASVQSSIERHKTAISRYQLSQPMQLLVRYGLIDNGGTVLDYGCGQGDDISALRSGGIEAVGWDPHYEPDAELRASDVVNLGFVLNVIEDLDERREALEGAWSICGRVLSVAVLTAGSGDLSNLRPYRDGFVTTRGTFQKYYRQEEIREFIAGTLNEDPVAVAPGILFVFRDKILEQSFLVGRRQRQNQRAVTLRPPRERKVSPSRAEKIERLRPQFEELWQATLDQGRHLAPQEVPINVLEVLQQERISLKRAAYICQEELFDSQDLQITSKERREDLLVYFALTMFSGKKNYSELPQFLQYDVKSFFGNHANALIEARNLLFSTGDSDSVRSACEESADEGIGYIVGSDAFQFHISVLDQLAPILRCFVGCTEVLHGDVSGADLLKVHIWSGKLTLLHYDDFSKPLPELLQRVKIDMRKQVINVFRYGGGERQYLYLKSLYLPETHDQFDEQTAFDRALMKVGLFDLSDYGPDADLFDRMLSGNGLGIDGFEIRKEGTKTRR
jgi:DNA phosphorothioation-associated putative methyltransferase